MSDGNDLVIGRINNGSNATELFRSSPPANDDAIYVQSDTGICIGTYTDAGWGVMGTGEGGGGVYGGTKAAVGVHAYSNNNYGVVGEGGNIGVYAKNLQGGYNAYPGSTA